MNAISVVNTQFDLFGSCLFTLTLHHIEAVFSVRGCVKCAIDAPFTENAFLEAGVHMENSKP